MDPRSYNAKTPLVCKCYHWSFYVLSLNYSCFYFEIPFLPRSLTYIYIYTPSQWRRIFLHFMLHPRQLQEGQKKNPIVPVVVVLIFFPYFLQIPTNQTDCKILNQIYNFQFQCKPINPNRLLGFFWVKKRHVGGWRKRKRYLMEIGKKQVDEKKSEENKKLV